MNRFIGLAFLTLGLAAGTPGLAHAQGLSGQIGGSVIDGSKGAIPGAAVTVRNTATAVTRETVTDAQGLFVFTNLFAGTYDLQVTLTGFRTYEQKGDRVDRDRTRRGAADRARSRWPRRRS